MYGRLVWDESAAVFCQYCNALCMQMQRGWGLLRSSLCASLMRTARMQILQFTVCQDHACAVRPVRPYYYSCCSKIAEAAAALSFNEKKWLVMHMHVQLKLDELRGPPNPWLTVT